MNPAYGPEGTSEPYTRILFRIICFWILLYPGQEKSPQLGYRINSAQDNQADQDSESTGLTEPLIQLVGNKGEENNIDQISPGGGGDEV